MSERLIALLNKEVQDYDEMLEKRKNLEADISLLEDTIIPLLESDNYDEMLEFGNWSMLEDFIPYFLKISEKDKKPRMNALRESIIRNDKYKGKKNKQKFLEPNKRYIEKKVKELEEALKQMKDELGLLNKKISEIPIEEYKEILRRLQTNRPINSDEYTLIENILKKLNLSDKEIILFLETIKKHNITSKFKNKDELNHNKLDEISNALTFGFELLEDIPWLDVENKEEVYRKKELDGIIDIVLTQNCSKKDMEELLPKYEETNLTFTNNYPLSCVQYVYISILRKFQETLLEYYSKLNNLDSYKDKEARNINIAIYNDTLQRYLFVRNLMQKAIDEYNKNLEEKRKQLETKEPDINVVHFGTKASGTTFLESDLKSISPDNYVSIRNLLTLFRKDKLPEIQRKKLKDISPITFEIKDDQIRIIYRHLQNNEYVILGVFIKKADNPKNVYDTYCNRKYDSIIDSKTVEEDLFTRFTPHKGGRRNS